MLFSNPSADSRGCVRSWWRWRARNEILVWERSDFRLGSLRGQAADEAGWKIVATWATRKREKLPTNMGEKAGQGERAMGTTTKPGEMARHSTMGRPLSAQLGIPQAVAPPSSGWLGLRHRPIAVSARSGTPILVAFIALQQPWSVWGQEHGMIRTVSREPRKDFSCLHLKIMTWAALSEPAGMPGERLSHWRIVPSGP